MADTLDEILEAAKPWTIVKIMRAWVEITNGTETKKVRKPKLGEYGLELPAKGANEGSKPQG